MISRFLCVIVLLCLLAFSGAHTTRTTFKKLQTKQQQRSLQQDTPAAPAAAAPATPSSSVTPAAPAPAASTPTAPATSPAPPAAATTTPDATAAPATPAAAATDAAAPATPAADTPAADATPAAGAAPDPADGDGAAIAEEAKKEVSEVVDEKVQPRVDAAGNKIGMGWKEKLKQEQEKNAYYQPELKPSTLADKDQELSDEEIDKMAEKDFAPIDALDAANATASAEAESKTKEKGGAHSEFDKLISDAKDLLAKVDEHFAKTGGPHVGDSAAPTGPASETPADAAAGAETKVAEGVPPAVVAEGAAAGAEAAAQEASAAATQADSKATEAKDEAAAPAAGTPPAAEAAKEETAQAAETTAKAADTAADAAKKDAAAAVSDAVAAKDAPPADAAKDAAAASTEAADAGASAEAAKTSEVAAAEDAKAVDPAAAAVAAAAPPPPADAPPAPAALIMTAETAPVAAPMPMGVPTYVSMPLMVETSSDKRESAPVPTAEEMIKFRQQFVPKNDFSMGAPVVPRPI